MPPVARYVIKHSWLAQCPPAENSFFLNPSLDKQSEQLNQEVWVDQEHRAIIDYLRSLARQPIEHEQSQQLIGLIALSDALENVGDSWSEPLLKLLERQSELEHGISPETHTKILELWDAIHLVLEDVVSGIYDVEHAVNALNRKPQIKAAQNVCERHLAERLASDDPDRLALYRIERDFCELLRIAHTNMRRAAKEILRIEQLTLNMSDD